MVQLYWKPEHPLCRRANVRCLVFDGATITEPAHLSPYVLNVVSRWAHRTVRAADVVRTVSGKPLTDGTHFSLSKDAGIVALAVADRPCGVDICAPFPADRAERMVLRFLPEHAEWWRRLPPSSRVPAFQRLWARTEAVIKAADLMLLPAITTSLVPRTLPANIAVTNGRRFLLADRRIHGAHLSIAIGM